MLVTGCANPAGESANDGYNGLYFTDRELREVVDGRRMLGVPVKAEHGGVHLGHVVSSYLDSSGRLNCVMKIDEHSVEGAIAAGLVRDGIASELSLGYAVDVTHSADGEGVQAQTKEIHEISLVREGARHACLITGYQDDSGATFTRVQAAARAAQGAEAAADPWSTFHLD